MNKTKTTLCLVLFFSFFLLTTMASAKTGLSLTTPELFQDVEDEYVETGVSLITPPPAADNLNITVNVSVHEAENWVTSDGGTLDDVGDIDHNDLGGLEGGVAGEYFHLDEDDYDYLIANLDDFETSDSDTTYTFNSTQMSSVGNAVSILDSWVIGLIGNFSGSYGWTAESPWLDFNGTYLDFNETKLQEDAEVTLQQEVTVVPIVGGVGSATTAYIDFEIKEIDVTCTSGMLFRFEATETTSGDIIDKDRKVHNTDWQIEKNYAIGDTVDLDFTSTNPATGSCTTIIKYLDNFT